jgi:hypothetical protein
MKSVDLLRKMDQITAEREQYHIIGSDERIVDGDEFNIVALESNSSDQPPDPSKS